MFKNSSSGISSKNLVVRTCSSLLLALLLSCVIIGCGSNEHKSDNSMQVVTMPELDSIIPDDGPPRPDSRITLIGRNFGSMVDDHFQGYVCVGQFHTTAFTWTDTELVIDNSYFEPGVYQVVVVTKRGNSNSLEYQVPEQGPNAPFIVSVDPIAGDPNVLVSVYGNNFGETQNNSLITISGYEMQVVKWSDTIIEALVPSQMDDSLTTIEVWTDYGVSNPIGFEVFPSMWVEPS
jgi:hypothetical protein